MRKITVTFMLICCMFIMVGCGSRHYVPTAPEVKETWSYSPTSNPIVKEDYAISITPAYWSTYRKGHGWHCFALTVENKTAKNIEIVWDKTLFVTNGATSGRFMFEGVVYKERNNSRANDIVFGNTTLNKLILPNNLVAYLGGRSIGWFHHLMPQGENGIYITLKVDDKEIGEKVLVNIRKE